MGPVQIVFLADSELLLPGASGAQPVLEDLRDHTLRMLRSAIAETSPRSVAAFMTEKSRFGSVLPGQHVAQRLLDLCGFGHERRVIRDASDLDAAADADLWVVLGTGAAAHGESAPLVQDSRCEEVDRYLSHALAAGNWLESGFEAEISIEVGATLTQSFQLAAQACEFAAFKSADFHQENTFGVTYFSALWKR